MFFRILAGIIPLSLRNGGHLIPFADPCLQVGATAPSDPPPPRLRRLWYGLNQALSVLSLSLGFF